MRHQSVRLPLASLALACAAVAPHASAQAAAHQSTAAQIVSTYEEALNTSIKSGDFAPVMALYAPQATVTFSMPSGVTKVFQGRVAIAHFYGRLRRMLPGFHWVEDSMRTLSPTVVLSYERPVTPSGVTAGQCSHLFVTQGDQIVSLDWVVYHN